MCLPELARFESSVSLKSEPFLRQKDPVEKNAQIAAVDRLCRERKVPGERWD